MGNGEISEYKGLSNWWNLKHSINLLWHPLRGCGLVDWASIRTYPNIKSLILKSNSRTKDSRASFSKFSHWPLLIFEYYYFYMHDLNSWWESLCWKKKRASWLGIIELLYLLTVKNKLVFMAVLTCDGFHFQPSFPNHFLGSSFSGHLFVFAKALDWSIRETTNIPRALIEKPRTQWSVIIDMICYHWHSTMWLYSFHFSSIFPDYELM